MIILAYFMHGMKNRLIAYGLEIKYKKINLFKNKNKIKYFMAIN